MFVLILTLYMYGEGSQRPVAVSQSSTPGFVSRDACVKAGKIAQQGALVNGFQSVVITYQCADLRGAA